MAYLYGRYSRYFAMNLSDNRKNGKNGKSGKDSENKINSINSNEFFRFRFRAAEIFLIIFLVVYIIYVFHMGSSRDVDISVISETLNAQCDLGGLESGDAAALKRDFGLSASEYGGYILYSSDDLMNVDELLIVKTADTSQLDGLENAVNERLESQLQKFHGYGTNQEELLQNAIIQERGDYFFYAVSERAEQWEKVFLDQIEN